MNAPVLLSLLLNKLGEEDKIEALRSIHILLLFHKEFNKFNTWFPHFFQFQIPGLFQDFSRLNR